MAAKFEIFSDKSKQYRFRLKASNGEIIATGEAYPTRAACLKGIASVQKSAPTAKIDDPEAKVQEASKKAVAKTSKAQAKNTTVKRPLKGATGRGPGRPPKNPAI